GGGHRRGDDAGRGDGRDQAPHPRIRQAATDLAAGGAERALARGGKSEHIRGCNGADLKRIVIFAAIVFAACASPVPPPAIAPRAEERYFVDPRLGFGQTVDASVEKKFDAAWRALVAGDLGEASRRLAEIRTKEPDYAPAELALVLVDLRQGALPAARARVNGVRQARPHFLAAEIYDAEVAVTGHDVKRAYD